MFAAWMRSERGWAEATICGCCHTVDRFFDWLDERGVALASVGITDIDQAVARYHARDYSRVTIHDYAQRLRTFFRFAEQQGWCTPGLAEGIIPSRFYPGETIPKGLNRDEVLRLLATTESNRPADLRDRAILMTLIAYGLRSGEVTGLQLDDLDWEEETLQVRCPKPGRTHLYPLSRAVGQAILRYIRELRPPRPERTLFLTLQAPIRPLSRGAMKHVVSSRLDSLGITGKRRGPHALRHAAAQHLLDQGLSMKEVGDYLGHRSVLATSVYAKVQDALLTIRDTKFHKNRLVPVDPQLAVALRAYAAKRAERPLPKGTASTFLANRDGSPLIKGTVRFAFARLLQAAGIHAKGDGRQAPCLHSLRHTAAVNRLTSWYRQGADVQRLLPALSTWLGHAHLDGTRVYLSMTPELLQEASARFDH